MSHRLTLPQSGALSGAIVLPSDKSISHRAVLFNSIAKGDATVRASTLGRDNFATIRIMRQLGVSIDVAVPPAMAAIAREELGGHLSELEADADCVLTVRGNGRAALTQPSAVLDCGNSGTTSRLLCGVLAAAPFESTLDGDGSLRRRPFRRVSEPLSKMGASFSADHLPITVTGTDLTPITYVSPVASAQVKSAILLAGLRATGTTSTCEPFLSRDHSERMLTSMGARITQRMLATGEWITELEGLGADTDLKAIDIRVPADFSQASFFLVAGSVIDGAAIEMQRVSFNPTRNGLFSILKRMGADITLCNEELVQGEEIIDLYVRSAELRAVQVEPAEVVSCIDEIPILCVAAAAARGVTRIDGVGELRVKESDRIEMTLAFLRSLGVRARAGLHHLEIEGVGSLSSLASQTGNDDAQWRDCGDHRILMSGAIAELAARGETSVGDLAAIETSFPNFLDCFQRLGCKLDDGGASA